MERQLKDCRRLAADGGMTVVEECVDNDISAFSRKSRPGWNKVLALVHDAAVDGLVVWHPDRMYRRLRELVELVDLLKETNVAVHTVQAGTVDLSTDAGRLNAHILGSLAEYESAHKASRIARAHLAKAEKGQWKGGRRPWGYGPDGVTPYEVEAGAIRRAATMILDGRTIADAARYFNEATEASEYREKSGASMTGRVLRDLLLSPRVVGRRVHVTQEQRERFQRERARSRAPLQPPWLRPENTYTAEWQPILDNPTWHALRAKLLSPEQLARRGRRPQKSMLAGLLKCRECFKRTDERGAGLLVSLGIGAKSYTCIGCGRVGISRDAVERLIVEKVTRVLEGSGDELASSEPPPTRGDAGAREGRRRDLLERQAAIAGMIADGLMTEAAARTSLQILANDLAVVSRAEDEAQRRAMKESRREDLLPTWLGASAVEKGAIIAQVADFFLVERVARSGQVFQPGRVLARWQRSSRARWRRALREMLLQTPSCCAVTTAR